MMPLCDACRSYEMTYQLHDTQSGPVRLCRRCFVRMDGRLAEQAYTLEHIGLDAVYERHKTMIEKVKAELSKDETDSLERMWALDNSMVKEGAMS